MEKYQHAEIEHDDIDHIEKRATHLSMSGPMGRQLTHPYSLVWTPLPLITWILPFIGHLGITTSQGVIHDFAGPYTVTVDDFAFGEPHKYSKLNIDDSDANRFDAAVEAADRTYRGMMHNLFCNNCHSHVAAALNKYGYQGKTNWNMVNIWFLTICSSSYYSFGHFLRTYCGFVVLVILFFVLRWITN
eukprot:TRINITY_DN2246_c0_g1_i1.p1 TRINITY_DN2246_c0_g1~~TRINITY_DN2246_c0_g1_i1.p1  ORF type:complete len:188 (-),score=14.44 TRINITY_DN2246_c0_g1_i1:123-686(-)